MEEIVREHLRDISGICMKHRVKSLQVFGSAATGKFDPESSDIDFVVEFQQMTPSEHADAYFGLMEDLEALLGRPVDLVEMEPVRNPYFRKSVDDSRVLVYALS